MKESKKGAIKSPFLPRHVVYINYIRKVKGGGTKNGGKESETNT